VAFGSRADLIQAGITVTCADTAMNTYTALGQKASPGNLGNIFEFYAKNITGNAANVVTCTISSSTTNLNISVTQYSGIDTTSPIDATFASGAADSATTATTGNLSTATADTVLISGCQVYNFGAAYTADSGYTIPSGATSSNGWVTTQYKIVSATQTNVTVTCTITPSNNIQLGFTAFKIAASAAGYVANPTVIVVGP
jgi:hypothetical protein